MPMILGFLINSIARIISVSSSTNSISFGLTMLSTLIVIIFGETDFSRLRPNGPYQVGFREFRSHVHDNEVSVYYPISKEHHRKHINERNTLWARHGEETLQGLARASGRQSYGGKGEMESIAVMRHLRKVYMDTVYEGDIAEDFKNGRKLIPIIFCHGISSNRTMQSGTCRDFASHGYIVFTFDHKDGTSSFLRSKCGTKTSYYDNTKKLYDYAHRRD
jgi:Platelet-activating factor acetylhydrolase, isoform II